MKTNLSLIRWLPRILCIVAIIYLLVYSLVKFPPQTYWQFSIMLIQPSLIFLMLVIGWKREIIGGILFIAWGVVLSPYFFMINFRINHSVPESIGTIAVILLPHLLIGLLFIWSGRLNKKSVGPGSEQMN